MMEDVFPVPKKSRFRSVTIEEVFDDDSSSAPKAMTYTQPSEVIEPDDSSMEGLLKTSPTEATSLFGTTSTASAAAKNVSSSTANSVIFNALQSAGAAAKSSPFGTGKSSAPKEPSKLRSSFIVEEEKSEVDEQKKDSGVEHEPVKAKAASSFFAFTPSSSSAPAFNPFAPMSSAKTNGITSAHSPAAISEDPKAAVKKLDPSLLSAYSFNFPSSSDGFSGGADLLAAREAAKAVPVSALPTFDLKRAASNQTAGPSTLPSPASTSVPAAAPKAFNWAAAGKEPKPASDGQEWTCGTCMLKNPASATEQCTICETPRPGAANTDKPANKELQPQSVFPKPMPAPAPSVKAFDWASAGAKPKPQGASASATWTCGTCMLQNPASATEKCTICEAPR